MMKEDFSSVPIATLTQAGHQVCTDLAHSGGASNVNASVTATETAAQDAYDTLSPISSSVTTDDAFDFVTDAAIAFCQQYSSVIGDWSKAGAPGFDGNPGFSISPPPPPPPPPPPVPTADQGFVSTLQSNPDFSGVSSTILVQAGTSACSDLGQNDGLPAGDAEDSAEVSSAENDVSVILQLGLGYNGSASTLVDTAETDLCPQYSSVVAGAASAPASSSGY